LWKLRSRASRHAKDGRVFREKEKEEERRKEGKETDKGAHAPEILEEDRYRYGVSYTLTAPLN
jgi:hypothetical protein